MAATDGKISDKVNRSPEFWQLNSVALQTTLFIAFGRLFDTRRDAHSILKFVDATIANPQLFSKTELRIRKRKASSIHAADDPDWLKTFVDEAWEPTSADLAPLKTALAPNHPRFKTIYQPIRHSFFAHRSMESEATIFARFQKTNIKEAEEILRFLLTLLWAVWELAWSAKKPDLADFHDYDCGVKDLNNKMQDLLRRLA